MPLDDKIRFHKLVIIDVHWLNYPILKRNMGITHWKVELSRTERHIEEKVNQAPAGCPTKTPGQSVA